MDTPSGAHDVRSMRGQDESSAGIRGRRRSSADSNASSSGGGRKTKWRHNSRDAEPRQKDEDAKAGQSKIGFYFTFDLCLMDEQNLHIL